MNHRVNLIHFLAAAALGFFCSQPEVASSLSHGNAQDPVFAEGIANVTAAVGRDVTLACVVDQLGTYKVAWIHYKRSTILTVHNHVITRNPRISVSHSTHRTWFLHIRNVSESDKGSYMCQINTEPVKTQIGYLTVVVPPDIIDEDTSSEVLVREGNNVTLKCRASGNPTPKISWTREDKSKFNIAKNKPVSKVLGELLEIFKVSRLHMGAYLCIANNGVPPAVSKRILLKVDFPTMLWIPHQLVGAPVGASALLECHTEAHPKSINYWAGADGMMIFPSEKYLINITESSYKLHMQMKIKRITKDDFGGYRCIAKNPLGETEGSIQLYETEAPTTFTPAHPVTQSKFEDYAHRKHDNSSTSYRNPSSLVVQEDTGTSHSLSGLENSAPVPVHNKAAASLAASIASPSGIGTFLNLLHFFALVIYS